MVARKVRSSLRSGRWAVSERRPILAICCKARELTHVLTVALGERRRRDVHEQLDTHFDQQLPNERIQHRVVGRGRPC